MADFIYVYIDKSRIIQEIDIKPLGDLMQYELHMIPILQAQDVLGLYEKWQQNPNSKANKCLLIETSGVFVIEKTIYIYYHFKDKSIRSITPRMQQNMDDDESLRCGLTVVDSLINEFINGSKNMLNFKVNNDGDLLYIEEIVQQTIEYDFLDNIPLMADYTVDADNKEAKIIIIYDGEIVNIKSITEVDNTKYHLFFISATDKTALYGSLFFDFSDNTPLDFSMVLPNDYIVISSFKKSMIFKEIRT